MIRAMSGFFGWSIYIFRAFGINVRIHLLFILYAAWQIGNMGSGQGTPGLILGSLFIAGLFFCILLHEFGHALAAKWCDGDADEILLWPLGGLAYCRPPFHPTAHLITVVAGPLVTFVIWAVLALGEPMVSKWATAGMIEVLRERGHDAMMQDWRFYLSTLWRILEQQNLFLLLFNLIPAFPMDGGRILRDALWHKLGIEKATEIAVGVGRVAAVGMIIYGVKTGNQFLIFIAISTLTMGATEVMAMAGQAASGRYAWSLKERLKRGPRRRNFQKQMEERMADALHTCHVCGRTDAEHPALEFRVAADGEEYCNEHLPRKPAGPA